MLGILLNQGCFILGVNLTSPGEASLVTTTMPMWVMLLAWLILREPITLKKAGGIVIGAAGAIILIMGSGSSISGENPALGDFIVLCAQLSYALYLTLYRNFIRKYSLVTLMKWMFLSATVIAIPGSFRWLASKPVIPLRFSKNGNPEIERWYATHFVDTKRVSQLKAAAAEKAEPPCQEDGSPEFGN